jgi:murein DD-endopeptidase
MRPFLKTWLTICLLLPLAAHASNREQRLPAGFSTQTVKTATLAKNDVPARSKPARTAAKVKVQPIQRKAPNEARNTRHQSLPTARASKAARSTARAGKARTAELHAARLDFEEPALASHGTRRGKHLNSLAAARATAAQMSARQSSEVLSRAVNVLGTPYVWGGSNPKKGFDCSGLVKYAFKDVHALDLPRTSTAMAEGHGEKVARKDLKPGDLLFFNIEGRRVNHVAIYLGNDRFIHAPRSGKSVSIDTLDKPYWDEHYVVAKRVLPKQQPLLRLSQR